MPKDDHVLTSETYKSIRLRGRGGSADAKALRFLRGESRLSDPGGLHAITKALNGWKGHTGAAESVSFQDARLLTLEMKEEGHGPRSASGLWNLEHRVPDGFPKELALPVPPAFGPVRPISDLDSPGQSERTFTGSHQVCIRFVTAATGNY